MHHSSRLSRRLIGTCTLLLACVLASAPSGAAQDAPATSPVAEMRRRNLESFDIVWRTIRDRHYDPTLGGVDWEAAREKYRPLVEQSNGLDEARGHMQAMIDLLGQSHMVLIPGSAMDVLAGEDDPRPPAEDQPAAPAKSAPATRNGSPPAEPTTAASEQPAGGQPPGEAPAAANGQEAAEGDAGFAIRLADTQTRKIIVTRVRPGSGAQEAGVGLGWQLLSLDGREVSELVNQIFEGLSQRGRGKPETYVALALEHGLHGTVGDQLDAVFLDAQGKQQALKIPFKASPGEATVLGVLPPIYVDFESRRIEHDGLKLGYIRFSAFLDPPQLSPQFEAAMRDFTDNANPVDGVVLDVRGNVGGIVMMVPGIAGYFINERGLNMGTLTTRDTELKLAVFPRLVQFAGPLAVLTDACSVSAAELLSGGLQGVGRARIFGTATAGEALPAQFLRLPNGDTFLFVFADYTTADGKRLEGGGVIPDEPVAYDQATLLGGEDPMLSAAARWVGEQKGQAAPTGN